MMAKSRLKVHVRHNHTATLVCPACGQARQVSVAKFRNDRHTLAVRCRCSHVYRVLLDFRGHYRKPTNLTGTYTLTDSDAPDGGVIRIHDISGSGVGFSVLGQHRIAPGHELKIKFQLTDRKRTELNKTVRVCRVQDDFIGGEFVGDNGFDKDLGFFLRR
jgi:hypothetical protein